MHLEKQSDIMRCKNDVGNNCYGIWRWKCDPIENGWKLEVLLLLVPNFGTDWRLVLVTSLPPQSSVGRAAETVCTGLWSRKLKSYLCPRTEPQFLGCPSRCLSCFVRRRKCIDMGYWFMSTINLVRCHFVRHCPLPNKKFKICTTQRRLAVHTCAGTAAITLKWAFSDIHHVSPTSGSINLGNLELMQLNRSCYLFHLTDPAVMRLVYKISYREFQYKPHHIGPCKYWAPLCISYTGQLSVNHVEGDTRL